MQRHLIVCGLLIILGLVGMLVWLVLPCLHGPGLGG